MNFAIIGKNVKNSLSPRIHKWIYNSLGLDHYYKAIDINLNNVDNIVNKLKEGALNGINVTIPFKRDFISTLEIGPPRSVTMPCTHPACTSLN